MRVGPFTATFGADFSRLFHTDITLAPAYGAGQVASGFLLASSLAIGTTYERRLYRNLSLTAAYRTPGTSRSLSFTVAEGTIKFVAFF